VEEVLEEMKMVLLLVQAEPAVVAQEVLLPLVQVEPQEVLIQVVAVVEAMEMDLDQVRVVVQEVQE
jgi:hypothetical protein